jgi:hypothetical protein
MHYAFPFLPLEVQTSIKEIIALGTLPESVIDLLIARTSKAIEDKTTSLQMDVVRIEDGMVSRVERIGQMLDDRLKTQHGASNQMLADIHAAVQQQGAAVSGLRAEFQSFGEDVSNRLGGVENRMDASENDRQALHEQNDRLEQKFDRLEIEVRQAMAGALGPTRVAELIAMIERHEKILGTTEAGN